jgi:uncharacterized cupredoxin-like copper-binding protein
LLSQFVLAQEPVVFNATETTLEVPEQLEAGFHYFALGTDGMKTYNLDVFRLHDGVTLEMLEPARNAIDEAYINGGDPAAAINELLELGDIVLNIERNAGAEQQLFGITLEEGNYAVGTSYEDETTTKYVYKTFEVVASNAPAAAPQVDQTIQLVDFAFAFPADLKAGEQIWEVVNNGKQLHHLILMKVKEGKTLEDVQTYADTGEGEDPTEEALGDHVGIMSPGRSVYHTVTLVPGLYVALCFMPDHSAGGDGAPHIAHGMMQSFTVSE